MTTTTLDAARPNVLASPWTWLGALLVAVALAVLGHTSAEAAGDDPHSDQPGLLASLVTTTADDVNGMAPAVGDIAARTVALTGGRPLVQSAVAPLRPTLSAVTGTLPAPVDGVAHDVVGALPAASAPASTTAEPPASTTRIAPTAPVSVPARARHALLSQIPVDPSSAPAPHGSVPAGSTSPDPTTPWSPGLPPLAPGAPGAGGLAALTAGLAASVAWAAVLTLLIALVVLARARMAAPLALRSAMHASRMRRPG